MREKCLVFEYTESKKYVRQRENKLLPYARRHKYGTRTAQVGHGIYNNTRFFHLLGSFERDQINVAVGKRAAITIWARLVILEVFTYLCFVLLVVAVAGVTAGRTLTNDAGTTARRSFKRSDDHTGNADDTVDIVVDWTERDLKRVFSLELY